LLRLWSNYARFEHPTCGFEKISMSRPKRTCCVRVDHWTSQHRDYAVVTKYRNYSFYRFGDILFIYFFIFIKYIFYFYFLN